MESFSGGKILLHVSTFPLVEDQIFQLSLTQITHAEDRTLTVIYWLGGLNQNHAFFTNHAICKRRNLSWRFLISPCLCKRF
jgi:hypothetical protein